MTEHRSRGCNIGKRSYNPVQPGIAISEMSQVSCGEKPHTPKRGGLVKRGPSKPYPRDTKARCARTQTLWPDRSPNQRLPRVGT